MRRAAAAGWLVALACRDPRPAAPQPVRPDAAVAVDAPGDDLGLGSAGGDPDEAPEEERIAAVERAMNELAPVANQCWAVAASDDFRLRGTIRALVAVGRGGARVEITADEPGDAALTSCLVAVLEAYPWAAPLDGQAVELPFRFTAPTQQNLIDRRMVAHRARPASTSRSSSTSATPATRRSRSSTCGPRPPAASARAARPSPSCGC
jgi:hypothetical protein